jgi:hypothetical protein
VRNAATAEKLGGLRGSTVSMGAAPSVSSLDGDYQYDTQYDTDTPAPQPQPQPQPTDHDVSGVLQCVCGAWCKAACHAELYESYYGQFPENAQNDTDGNSKVLLL